ncbi:hypothetical protein F3087_12085 [Nocardia colli]|uniref:Uncharacterized protein n=1 Tax=Nocardia colli TaxID=2545717 RepID=A0A5N0EGX7_9NOCA|nr:hypothetical protein [Nocardia colli]KAA8887839.1 hypothetical protein F3087_12085 [Nocardia colli]
MRSLRAEGVVIVAITMAGLSAMFRNKGGAIVHRLCHIVKREKFAGPNGQLISGVGESSAERLSICGVLCCVKLAVLLVVTVL